MLALIVLDFYQLISNPLEFKEYTAMCNQLKRGLVMLAIVTVILLFSYVKFVLQLINFEMDLVFALNLLGWMMKKQFAADLITSSLFYLGITIVSSVLLYRMIRLEKTPESQPGTSQAKVRPLILATLTFLVVMVSSYIVEIVKMLREKILKSSYQDVVSNSEILLQIHYYHEGVCGFVLMMSFFFWFPRLRPKLRQK